MISYLSHFVIMIFPPSWEKSFEQNELATTDL